MNNRLELEKNLEEAIVNVMQLLDKAHHPHTSIIITSTTAEIVEGLKVINNDVLVD